MIDVFKTHRPLLFGIAYRMTGQVGEAEDVLQDVWLRWQKQDAAGIQSASTRRSARIDSTNTASGTSGRHILRALALSRAAWRSARNSRWGPPPGAAYAFSPSKMDCAYCTTLAAGSIAMGPYGVISGFPQAPFSKRIESW